MGKSSGLLLFLKQHMGRRLNDKAGFTLPEVLISAYILVVAFVGIMFSYVGSMALAETAGNTTNAMVAVESRMEEIKNTQFSQLVATYDNVVFTSPNLDGIGVSYVDNSNADLFIVRVSFCWRQKDGRISGECVVDGGTGSLIEANFDGDGIMDSPVQIVTAIYN
jgi:type II secretory pathway pseudopilin PulG